jgi:hypothetical protein
VKNVKELGLAVPLTLQTRADEVIEWNDGRPLRCFAIRPGRHLPARPSTACLSLLHFELLDKCSEMRRNGRRQSVVPVLQESPNYYEGRAPIASGIYVVLRGTRNDMATYPVVDPISRDDGFAHGPLPTFSASRFAPPGKRATIARGSDRRKRAGVTKVNVTPQRDPAGLKRGGERFCGSGGLL